MMQPSSRWWLVDSLIAEYMLISKCLVLVKAQSLDIRYYDIFNPTISHTDILLQIVNVTVEEVAAL